MMSSPYAKEPFWILFSRNHDAHIIHIIEQQVPHEAAVIVKSSWPAFYMVLVSNRKSGALMTGRKGEIRVSKRIKKGS